MWNTPDRTRLVVFGFIGVSIDELLSKEENPAAQQRSGINQRDGTSVKVKEEPLLTNTHKYSDRNPEHGAGTDTLARDRLGSPVIIRRRLLCPG